MPIEIKVTKEIGNYEPKFIGPFTTRQAIVFGSCGAAAILMYRAASTFLPSSMAWYACMLPGAVAVLFNTPFYGMRFEEFIKSVFINVFLAPTYRRYRTENTMEERIRKMSEAFDSNNQAKNINESKTTFSSILTFKKKDKPNNEGTDDKKPYKMSSKAIR